jgi:hypothetical protein
MLTMTGDRPSHINPLAMHTVYAKGNMETITEMIPIDISRIPRVVENVFVGVDYSLEDIQIYKYLFKEFHNLFSWYYEEMPCIDTIIVEHEIPTYPDAKMVRLKLRLVNPQKETTIKAEVEKMIKASFIYPIQLTQWVSNPIPFKKK